MIEDSKREEEDVGDDASEGNGDDGVLTVKRRGDSRSGRTNSSSISCKGERGFDFLLSFLPGRFDKGESVWV